MGETRGDGREVESFGVLAQRNGAKSVVATLWSVADDSTSLLMREFYRLREQSPGMLKSEALREAQLALLRGSIRPPGHTIASRGVKVRRQRRCRRAGGQLLESLLLGAVLSHRELAVGAKPPVRSSPAI